MARLFTSGFETTSTTSGVEFTTVSGGPTIQNTVARLSLGYAGKITSLSAGTAKYFSHQFATADSTNNLFARTYFRVDTYPNASSAIGGFFGTTGNPVAGVVLNSNGTLDIFDNAGSLMATSSALTTGQWYRLEHQNHSNSGHASFYIDGTALFDHSTGSLTAAGAYRWGGNCDGFNTGASTGTWYFDDIAINDGTAGGSQSAFPGSGKVLLRDSALCE